MVILDQLVGKLPGFAQVKLEEIRIRKGRPIEWVFAGQSWWLDAKGQLTHQAKLGIVAEERWCQELLDQLTGHSVYSFEDQMRQGFITAEGGHRVGLSGQVTLSGGKVKLIRDVTAFNVRIARERKGIAGRLLPWLVNRERQTYYHTLIMSPPQHGKTTLLRDVIRMMSDGCTLRHDLAISGVKVGLIDERSEIAGCVRGAPMFDVGLRTDIMDQCPKAEGIMMMIRSMSPQIVAVDEIGHEGDVTALREALVAGVKVVATIHGTHIQELASKPMFRALHDLQLFERIVVLHRKEHTHSLMKVYDAHGVCLSSILEPWGD